MENFEFSHNRDFVSFSGDENEFSFNRLKCTQTEVIIRQLRNRSQEFQRIHNIIRMFSGLLYATLSEMIIQQCGTYRMGKLESYLWAKSIIII